MLKDLRLLTWKNIIIKRQHYILTIMEIALPIYFFNSMFSSFSQAFKDKESNNTLLNKYDNYNRSSVPINLNHIWYTPQNQFTNDIIERIRRKKQIRILGKSVLSKIAIVSAISDWINS